MLGLGEAAAFFGGPIIRDSKAFRSGTGEILRHTYSGSFLPLRSQADFECRARIRACRRRRLEVNGS